MWSYLLLEYQKSDAGPSVSNRARLRAARKRPASPQLQVEALEDRCLLSFTLAVPHSVGLVAFSAAVGTFNSGGNHEVATVSTPDCCQAGSWIPAASMAERRAFYSATLLDDGRVLVAGGLTVNIMGPPPGGRYTAEAQIYDPDTDSWETTGHLATARAGHAAVRLDDGRVLVAGGQTLVGSPPPVFLNSAEIYDPATGEWTATGSMHVRRTEPILTLLDDGRVFVSGGTRAVSRDAASAEIYDPATGEWTRVADMSTPRNDHIQMLLDDGRVLVAGGFRDTLAAPGAYFDSAEIYDPDSNTWTTTGSMTMRRADAEAVRLEDGRVLVTGGNTAISFPATRTNTAEIYDPATGQWMRTGGTMSDAKVDHAITLLKHGRVLVAGGIRSNDAPTASADIYDPRTDAWTPVPSMSKARGGVFAVALEDGQDEDRRHRHGQRDHHDQDHDLDGSVLVVGGLNFDPGSGPSFVLASAEIFEPCDGAFPSIDRRGASIPQSVGDNSPADSIADNVDGHGTTQSFLLTGGTVTAIDFLATIFSTAKPPVNPTTPPSSAPTGVGVVLPRADEFTAAGTAVDGGLAISPAKHNLLGRADDLWSTVVGTDGAMCDWPFPALRTD